MNLLTSISNASNVIGIIALISIFGCIIYTTIHKKNHPEKYKGETGNVFNILFGTFLSDITSDSREDYYYKNTKYGRRHIRSVADQFKQANEKRNAALNQYINPDENNNKEADEEEHPNKID